MSGDTTNSELTERLREIREAIRQSITAPEPRPTVVEIPQVRLDEVWKAERLGHQYANELGKPNPRPSGIANDVIQAGKNAMARSLDWMLRPQREFNQAVLQAISGLASALEQSQHSQQAAVNAVAELGRNRDQELREIRTQLRELSDLVAAKLERSEAETRESVRDLRWSYEGALARHIASVEETRRRLNEEVRELNRRLAAQAKASALRPAIAASSNATMGPTPEPMPRQAAATPASAPELQVDYFALEKDFRGTEADIKTRQKFYLPYFQNCTSVLDIACGRGEFLELMREAGVPATGVDLDADMVGRCLEKGLSVAQADVFEHLSQISDASLGGIFCSQFVEHLMPADYSRLVMDAARKLIPGGMLAIETQNPECLAIFSKSFYIDPTHVKPIPAAQLRFLFAQAGFEEANTHYMSPSSQQFPLLQTLSSAAGVDAATIKAFNKSIEDFNAAFFGGMDYAVIGRRPGGR